MRVLLLVLCLFIPEMLISRTIVVAPAGKITSLKNAVALAKDGDTIIVKAGKYNSFNTLIDKQLTILGQGYPVLDAGFKEECLTITAHHVKLDGFIVKNSKTGAMRDYAGIRLHHTAYVTISNNKLLHNFFGIYVSDSRNIQILNNECKGSAIQMESGNGIHLWKSNHITIKNNYVTGHRDGIYFEFVKASLIHHNLSEKNFRYGLHFMFSDDDVYQYNTFKNNGSGVAVMYSKRIKMTNNVFKENWGSSIYGLLLKDISYSQISNNNFIRNTTGVYMEACEEISINKNNFNNNGWAIRVLANCINSKFIANNFIANSFDVSTNGTLNLNHFEHNYWDKYEGYDLNKNGIGDIPYRPISLYAQIMEQIPQSVMLMRSFIINLMDKVERSIPSVTPESVKDVQPKMKPWKNL
ncbi:nitrous oxide reductase family maturation protein NosD [Pedobacter glucosidilyticus]|nr:nitrous oxide reductase family maturation protein NosD [Pedobacter glucosidilyticus]KHJ39547.1 nitrous oxide reductase family maturation protein NosD [Pedobacter glucosidilyticus]